MPIIVDCPGCKAKLQYPDTYSGQDAPCPACKQTLKVSKPQQEVLRPETTQNRPANDFIKFNCPNCDKLTGFHSILAGQTANCPACHVSIMIPEKGGGESFIIGTVPLQAAPTTPSLPPDHQAGFKKVTPESTKKSQGEKIEVAPSVSPKAPTSPKTVLKRSVKTHSIIRSENNSHLWIAASAAGLVAILLAGFAIGKAGQRNESAPLSPDPTETAQPEQKQYDIENLPAEKILRHKNEEEDRLIKSILRKAHNRTTPQTREAVKVDPLPEEKQKNTLKPLEMAEQQNTATNESVPVQEKRDLTDIFALQDRKKNHNEDDLEVLPPPAPDNQENKAQAQPNAGQPSGSDDGNENDLLSALLGKKKTAPETPVQEPKATSQATPLSEVTPKARIDIPDACKRCLDFGYMITAYTPYFRIEGEGAPHPSRILPWQQCPDCKKGLAQTELVATEEKRLDAWLIENKELEQKTGMQLIQAETRYITIHAEMPEVRVKNTIMTLDKLTEHLQKTLRTCYLTQTRPNTHEILIFWNKTGYLKFIASLEAEHPGTDFSLSKQASGSFSPNRAFFETNSGAPPGPEHMALFQLGQMLITEATQRNTPYWLREGFAAYCEHAVTKKNLVHSFTYEKSDVQFDRDWDVALKKYAKQHQLTRWREIWPVAGVGMNKFQYLTCYGVVSFLIEGGTGHPQRFQEFIRLIREGIKEEAALTKSYGIRLEELEQRFLLWTQTLR